MTIIGVGLIGGSLGLALRKRGLAGRVVGVGRDPERLEEARRLGAIDEGTTELADGLAGASVAVVCTPVNRLPEIVIEAAKVGPNEILLTDAGSTKRALVERVEADPGACSRFVGAHPIAGSERSGVANARDDLFEGQTCVLTRTSRTPPERFRRAEAFWSSVGSRIMVMSPSEHDLALAMTSHLPHVAASALASVVDPAVLGLAAGGYRDGTRVAGADPDLWTAIYLDNRRPLMETLDRYLDRLASFRDALRDADAERIQQFSREARENRAVFDRLQTECRSPIFCP
ncbi:MAG TPA: prephenate dehydrogenase/arogenate dehydrogenase family protein [Isosphaeraceae bacterium]|nr:prephenate dehydrogenase/arogenate dehydrogenase family protein [Isosphaeraceae bacterium]